MAEFDSENVRHVDRIRAIRSVRPVMSEPSSSLGVLGVGWPIPVALHELFTAFDAIGHPTPSEELAPASRASRNVMARMHFLAVELSHLWAQLYTVRSLLKFSFKP